jgi:hypothetical protein
MCTLRTRNRPGHGVLAAAVEGRGSLKPVIVTKVAVAVMSDEFARDIAVNAAKHRALPHALDAEAGASAELGDRGDDQIDDATSMVLLVPGSFSPLRGLGGAAAHHRIHGTDPCVRISTARDCTAIHCRDRVFPGDVAQ